MARGVDDKMSFMEHLGELRVRIVRSLYALLAGSVPGLYFSQQIVDWLARPVTSLNYSLVFTSPAEALWVQMKVGLIVGVFISAPAILWQVWAFIAPGLHAHERKYALPFVIIGSLLFIGGGAFSLFVVTPYALQFLLSYARPGLQPMITLQNLTDFLLKFTLAFGAVFELPLALTLLARLGVVNANMLAKNRKYAILGAFIAGGRRRAPHARHPAHPRAGRPHRVGRAPPRPVHAVPHARGLRRHRLREAARGARRRLRHPRGHARPAHRLPQAACLVAQARRGPRHRRGRPDVRHGVHRRPALHPPAPAAARQTSVVPLLRDALVPGARAHVGVHEQPVPDHDHAAAKDGRARGADALPRRPRREVSAAPRSPQARGWRPDPDLHEHPRGSAAARGAAAAQPLRHARADRRRGPEAAPQDPERLQGGPAARARGDRRRLARPPHRGGEPRRQLGPAAGRRGLRPSHWPHGPRGRGRQGALPRGRGERALPRADREVHRPEDPRGVGGRRPLRGRDQADRRRAPPVRRGAPRAARGARRSVRRPGPSRPPAWRARPAPSRAAASRRPASRAAPASRGRGRPGAPASPPRRTRWPAPGRAYLRSGERRCSPRCPPRG